MLGGFSGACCAECSRMVPSLVRPRLTSVHFTPQLDRIVIAFDAATNMPAGCPLDATTQVSLSDATCFWSDATTLVVAMSGSSAIRGGDTVQVAPGAVWPSGYTGARCDEVHVCSDVASAWTLSAALPCDDLRTNATVELCALPTAQMIVSSLSACPGSTLLLDGAYSSAGLSSPSYVRHLSPPTTTPTHPTASKVILFSSQSPSAHCPELTPPSTSPDAACFSCAPTGMECRSRLGPLFQPDSVLLVTPGQH